PPPRRRPRRRGLCRHRRSGALAQTRAPPGSPTPDRATVAPREPPPPDRPLLPSPLLRSAEDVANIRRLGSRRVCLLLVVARQHLADQAEREKLHADHHEKNAEKEQWALSDPGAADLHHREVQENHEAGETRAEADPAEQVQRAVAVT